MAPYWCRCRPLCPGPGLHHLTRQSPALCEAVAQIQSVRSSLSASARTTGLCVCAPDFAPRRARSCHLVWYFSEHSHPPSPFYLPEDAPVANDSRFVNKGERGYIVMILYNDSNRIIVYIHSIYLSSTAWVEDGEQGRGAIPIIHYYN